MKSVQEIAAPFEGYVVEMRRYFHAHPEISRHEVKTLERIAEELRAAGMEPRVIGKEEKGITVDIKGTEPGKTILLRADVDALSVTEMTGCEYASQNPGVMHACGHDCHIAMLLAAARMLNSARDQIKGTVRLIFQPAEEVATGAHSMIADGILDGVDAAFGMHIWSDIPSGMVSVGEGARMAACDQFAIDVDAKAGHGAQPHLCVDASLVASAITMNLQSIVSREIDPTKTAVVTVGIIQSGTRWNVISGTAHLEGTARCFERDVLEHLPVAIKRIAEETAAAYRAKVTVKYDRLIAPTINHASMTPFARKAAETIFGENWRSDYGQTMGGEDFSAYIERVPGCIALLGCGNPECDSCWPQHSDHYQVDESVLIKGAMLHVQTALNYLS